MSVIILNPNPNKVTIRIQRTGGFPAIPTKWTDRFDVKIWNELESICIHDVVKGITPNKRISKCTYITCVFFWIFLILSNALLGGYLGSEEYHEYCSCRDSYGSCCGWTYGWDQDESMFAASMAFYGFMGFCLICILPCAIYYDCYYYKRKLQNDPSSNINPEHLNAHFNSLNQKYQNMIVFQVISLHNPSKECKCCASVDPSSEIYFDIEIEMKVQTITHIPGAQTVDSLPTQQQVIQTVASLPTQQQVQSVASLPVQPQPGAGYPSNVTMNGFQQKHYTQWSTQDVLDWIIQLENGKFVMYKQQLTETLNAEQIDGNDVMDLDKDDVHRLGIQNFKLKKCLLDHIESLSQPITATAPAAYAIDMESVAASAPEEVNEGAVTNI
eukprot:114892_1